MFLDNHSFIVSQLRHTKKAFLMILFLSFSVRIYWMITQKGVIENEGGEYARLAENVLAGKGYLSSLEEQPNLM